MGPLIIMWSNAKAFQINFKCFGNTEVLLLSKCEGVSTPFLRTHRTTLIFCNIGRERGIIRAVAGAVSQCGSQPDRI